MGSPSTRSSAREQSACADAALALLEKDVTKRLACQGRGAAEVIERLDPKPKPLGKQRWAGVVDSVRRQGPVFMNQFSLEVRTQLEVKACAPPESNECAVVVPISKATRTQCCGSERAAKPWPAWSHMAV